MGLMSKWVNGDNGYF